MVYTRETEGGAKRDLGTRELGIGLDWMERTKDLGLRTQEEQGKGRQEGGM